MQTFFDMAWNIDAFDIDNVNTHQAKMLANIFGKDNFQSILDTYLRLAWSRKPEYMGWEYEWDDKAHTGLKPTEFSFQNYSEAQQRLADYKQISDEVEDIMDEVKRLKGKVKSGLLLSLNWCSIPCRAPIR